MPFLSAKATPLQKTLIFLFILTIVLACLSLVWLQFEKPGKVTRQCKMANEFLKYHNYTFDGNYTTLNQLNPECPTTINPPMSMGLDIMINLTVIVGTLFFCLSIYAYLTRKPAEKQEKPPEPPGTT